MDFNLAALKVMVGKLKEARQISSMSLGILVSCSKEEDDHYLLDDGRDVIELILSNEFCQRNWKLGMYVIVVGLYVHRADEAPMIRVCLLARSNDFNKITIFGFGVGKLGSDFLGTKFGIFDSQPPYDGAKPSSSRASRRFASKQISPQLPAGNFEIGQVSYKFNLLKLRGPRRMLRTLQCPESKQTVDEELKNSLESPKSTPPTG